MFGLETEFGFTALASNGKRVSAMQRYFRMCKERLPHLNGGGDTRMFLETAALIYSDCQHPELATAECCTPDQLLMSVRTGEHMLQDTAAALEQATDLREVRLFRTNVDYALPNTTWGCHENYLATRHPDAFRRQLIPHLATRIVYTGSGGLNSRSAGVQFTLSPRTFHLAEAAVDSSSSIRAIYNVKPEPLCEGFHRLHLMCGDTGTLDLPIWLKIGTTSLIVALIDAGRRPGDAVQIEEPLAAMRSIALDTRCDKRMPIGKRRKQVTAIAIQRHYLQRVEDRLHEPYMPPWAENVCRRWRWVLDRLEDDPLSLCMTLDWPAKLALFKRYLNAHSTLRWDELPALGTLVERSVTRTTDRLQEIRDRRRLLQARVTDDTQLELWSGRLREQGHERDTIAECHKLRQHLGALDLRFGELGPRGIASTLRANGALEEEILSPEQIEHALRKPPSSGRARIRGECVRRLAPRRDQFECHWDRIIARGKYLDLRNPFENEERWHTTRSANPS